MIKLFKEKLKFMYRRKYDKMYCLEIELAKLVTQIYRAKSLKRLKEVTKLNFPKEWATLELTFKGKDDK